MVTRWRSI